MSEHVQFELGLAKYELVPIALISLNSIIVILISVFLRNLGWMCFLIGGIVFFWLAYVIRSIAGTRITTGENGLTIYRTGNLAAPISLSYEDIGYAERIHSSSRMAIWTRSGQFFWIGPFQDFDFFSSRRKLDELTRIVCERAHIREGEVPEGAESERPPK